VRGSLDDFLLSRFFVLCGGGFVRNCVASISRSEGGLVVLFASCLDNSERMRERHAK